MASLYAINDEMERMIELLADDNGIDDPDQIKAALEELGVAREEQLTSCWRYV